MNRILIAGLAMMALADAAAAAPRHDRRLDEAAARIVAAKMGDIRGTFDAARKPVFVRAVQATRQVRRGLRPGEWNRGLAVATGRRAYPIASF